MLLQITIVKDRSAFSDTFKIRSIFWNFHRVLCNTLLTHSFLASFPILLSLTLYPAPSWAISCHVTKPQMNYWLFRDENHMKDTENYWIDCKINLVSFSTNITIVLPIFDLNILNFVLTSSSFVLSYKASIDEISV